MQPCHRGSRLALARTCAYKKFPPGLDIEMIITCPSCSARYKLDPAQFGPEGRRVRCTKCAHVWTELPPDDLPRPVVPDVSAAVGAAMEGMSGADTGTDAGADAPPRLDFQPPGDAVARAAAQRRIAAAQGGAARSARRLADAGAGRGVPACRRFSGARSGGPCLATGGTALCGDWSDPPPSRAPGSRSR